MTIKEFKNFLESFEDNQEIFFNSESGLQWEILPEDLLLVPEKYKKKPKIIVRVK